LSPSRAHIGMSRLQLGSFKASASVAAPAPVKKRKAEEAPETAQGAEKKSKLDPPTLTPLHVFATAHLSKLSEEDKRDLQCKQLLTSRMAGMKGFARLQTSLGHLNLQLHCDQAPRTCLKFIELVEKGFYKNAKFHTVVPSLYMQLGASAAASATTENKSSSSNSSSSSSSSSSNSNGKASDAPTPIAVEFNDSLKHDARGILSMKGTGNTANPGQLLLTLTAAKHFDNKNVPFATVVGGNAVLDQLERVKLGNTPETKTAPVEELLLQDVTIFTTPFSTLPWVSEDELKKRIFDADAKAEAERKAAEEAEKNKPARKSKWVKRKDYVPPEGTVEFRRTCDLDATKKHPHEWVFRFR